MTYSTKNLDKGRIEFTITVEPTEYDRFLKGAAVRISDRVKISGFRPGHVPYDIVVKNVGEMAVYENALQKLIPTFYAKAAKELAEQKNMETTGEPEIDVTKLAPGNPIVFVVRASLIPEIKLPDVSKIKVEKREPKVEEAQVDKIITDLQKIRAAEIIVDRPAGKNDKIIIDINMQFPSGLDGKAAVPIEGGQTRGHGIYLNEDYYIPGLPNELVGLKKGDKKTFKLKMPENHYQKNMAGRDVEFNIAVNDVYERKLSDLDDKFAEGLGQKSITALKELIKKNLIHEEQQKAEQKYDIALLEAVLSATKFGEIPEQLIQGEKEKMLSELKFGLEKQKQTLDQYLQAIKRTPEELQKEWTPEAEKRAKAALLARQFAREHNITVDEKEINEERGRIMDSYREAQAAGGKYDLAQIESRLNDEHITRSIIAVIQNRKVMEEIKKLVAHTA